MLHLTGGPHDTEQDRQGAARKRLRLATPADNRSYYRDFSDHYDDTFAKGLGYALPRATTQRYLDLHDATDTPIADIGCGTGLLAEALPDFGPHSSLDRLTPREYHQLSEDHRNLNRANQ